eukprot:3036930-Pleurochrysis_carterae.AAC.1
MLCPSVVDQAQKDMQGLQVTTKPGALHKSGLRFTETCVVEYFGCNLAHCFGVDKLVELFVGTNIEIVLNICQSRLWTMIDAFKRRRRGLERHGHQYEGNLRRGVPTIALQV